MELRFRSLSKIPTPIILLFFLLSCFSFNTSVGILAILGETVKTVEGFSTTKCNGSTIGDCIPVNEEFLMESEISRRILAQPPQPVTNQAIFKPNKPFCDRGIYGSCIGVTNTRLSKRPCNYNNGCGGRGQ